MATLADLPADQRAVLSLVLAQGRSYDELGAALSIDRAEVRQRALAALDALGPETGTPPPQRALLTDYLLGQLPPRVAEQIYLQLARSESDRAWASAVAAELEPLAAAPLPPIPEPAAAAKPSSRRGGAILLSGLGLVVAAGVALVLAGVFEGSSGRSGAPPASGFNTAQGSANTAARSSTSTAGGSTATTGAATAPSSTPFSSAPPGTSTQSPLKVLARLALLPPRAIPGHRAAGIAEVVRDGSHTGIVIVAQGLPANTARNAYAVWLTDPVGASAFLGFVSQLVTSSGKLTADGAVPADVTHYTRVLLTLETHSKPRLPGLVVLEGDLSFPG
jgi:hypothetical protein